LSRQPNIFILFYIKKPLRRIVGVERVIFSSLYIV
jgi:hypothetical protein